MEKKKIVILGAGFAGLKLARKLNNNPNFSSYSRITLSIEKSSKQSIFPNNGYSLLNVSFKDSPRSPE